MSAPVNTSGNPLVTPEIVWKKTAPLLTHPVSSHSCPFSHTGLGARAWTSPQGLCTSFSVHLEGCSPRGLVPIAPTPAITICLHPLPYFSLPDLLPPSMGP